ncbi:hypothetical protein MZJ31_001915 [Vibrio parahaemolyticus]|uniref:hypothetical protein n=1 Tax=Vibrio sp. Vb2135 TaxID=3074653 RepID=UPI001A1F51B9|nr:hypothetical protein [Vibrio sp. Vb2135]EGQ7904145.1 hypothetical protein [Vibrio alginolyticus]EJC7102467.1 hypothetical protein [Vibrio parahaemolyticus]EJC7106915.1 hypothetical protein [Vibrio parahaemolyticus]ELY3409070.1 hypothetical protein [Vibrio parahaemolyticus]MDW1763783.1 hypothetical protein [Vibrio sp. Vb2135]
MAIKFEDCNISDNKVGVRTPSDADMTFKNTDITRNEVGVDIYVSKELASFLSIPENTPQSYIQEVKELLEEHAAKDNAEKEKLLEDSRLFKWLGHASSLSSLASALISMF